MRNPFDNPIIKGIVTIAGLILLVALIAAARRKSSVTMEDYARENPEAAYARSENSWRGDGTGLLQSVTAPVNTEQEQAAPAEKAPEAATSETPEEIVTEAQEPDAEIAEESVEPIEEPAPDFYAEELSEEVKARITGISYPADDSKAKITYDDLRYLHVLYNDFDGNTAEGELICNKAIAEDLLEIFEELYKSGYSIEKIRLIDEYAADDDASIADNNTSCFNYRTVDGTDRLSNHAYGLAIDINPFYNPYVRFPKSGGTLVSPPGAEAYADRSAEFPYKIDYEDLCYRLFKEHGFTWGGDWNSVKDYQHFEKTN